jgi:hypothetical protein
MGAWCPNSAWTRQTPRTELEAKIEAACIALQAKYEASRLAPKPVTTQFGDDYKSHLDQLDAEEFKAQNEWVQDKD